MEPLLLEPDFTYAVMKTKSAAAANLCNWVINIINFNKVRPAKFSRGWPDLGCFASTPVQSRGTTDYA